MENPKMDSPSMEGEDFTKECEVVIQSLHTEKDWDGLYLYRYKNFLCPEKLIRGMINFQTHFKALNSDLFLITIPKSGTTWLKALSFAIVNRRRYADLSKSPLVKLSPHQLVKFLEFDIYLNNKNPNLDDFPSPRIFSTHTPYAALPSSILDSNSKIFYMCRNPWDQFISHWQFKDRVKNEAHNPIPIEDAFEMFCNGIEAFGPFWDHALGYWNASLEKPNKVLFLRYEDLKNDIVFNLKKLAHFLGFPFTEEEESKGVIDEIVRLCSFENLKDLEANKSGNKPFGLKNSVFFRKGEVGDWANYLTPTMVERVQKIMEDKFRGSRLNFDATL